MAFACSADLPLLLAKQLLDSTAVGAACGGGRTGADVTVGSWRGFRNPPLTPRIPRFLIPANMGVCRAQMRTARCVIGWSGPLQWQRLRLIANNSRFLLLPGVRVKNLASRILGLNLARLSEDWQRVHGHGLVLAETFIDPSRFAGTC